MLLFGPNTQKQTCPRAAYNCTLGLQWAAGTPLASYSSNGGNVARAPPRLPHDERGLAGMLFERSSTPTSKLNAAPLQLEVVPLQLVVVSS